MKALVCRALDGFDALAIGELPRPEPGPGQVRIAVRAAALNFLDVLTIHGRYQSRPALPFVPGAEFSGVVDAIGPGAAGVREGDRVAAFGLGGYGEFALADARSTVRIPEALGFDDAAALFLAHGTVLRALARRGALREGETLLVLGASGGVGQAAIELGRLLGATVIAAASTAAKLDACRELGAQHTIDYSLEPLRERCDALTHGRGVDVAFDPVGGDLTEAAVRSLGWGGRLLVVGFAAGPIPSIPANLLLFRERAAIGVYWGESIGRDPEAYAADAARLAEWRIAGELRSPVREIVPLSGAIDALRRMAGRATVGKVVVRPGE